MRKTILTVLLFAGFIALNAAPPVGQWKSMNWKNTSVSYEKGTLNLEIRQAQKFHGGAVLTILKPEPDKTFVFSAEVTSREPEVAYLSVKLYKGKKEIRRISSPMNSSEKPAALSVKFHTKDADRIELLVRTIQIPDTVGTKVTARKLDLKTAEENVR